MLEKEREKEVTGIEGRQRKGENYFREPRERERERERSVIEWILVTLD